MCTSQAIQLRQDIAGLLRFVLKALFQIGRYWHPSRAVTLQPHLHQHICPSLSLSSPSLSKLLCLHLPFHACQLLNILCRQHQASAVRVHTGLWLRGRKAMSVHRMTNRRILVSEAAIIITPLVLAETMEVMSTTASDLDYITDIRHISRTLFPLSPQGILLSNMGPITANRTALPMFQHTTLHIRRLILTAYQIHWARDPAIRQFTSPFPLPVAQTIAVL